MVCYLSCMRLVTYSRLGVPSIGVELEKGILDIPEAASRFGRQYHIHGHSFPHSILDLLRWDSGIEVVKQIVSSYHKTPLDEKPMLYNKSSISYEAPIQRPGKIIALGLNYRDHIEETGRDIPDFPVIFAKFPSCVVGPDTEVKVPEVTKQLDWEVELGIVMGHLTKNVEPENALDKVAGYTIINDLSARDLQHSEGQWVRGKSLDGLCPMGPSIVTTDELGDASGLRMHTKVNGVTKQESNTSNLLFGTKEIVSFLSKSFSLEPGDVIATGTPSGVGFARDPPEFLNPGDEVELYIEKIGYLRNRIV
ncbi:MAG: FAA hydrolase family protein [Candidatus Lokiarchaeota archaeon]|nr:FAA hydrolase family protein [Candidatus Lokiarchaeota archaeon]